MKFSSTTVIQIVIFTVILSIIGILRSSIEEQPENTTVQTPVIVVPYCDRWVTNPDFTREVQQHPCED